MQDGLHSSNESLYQLVQTLLEVYRYESGAMQLSLEEHNLEKMIEGVVLELQPLAKPKNIKIVTDISMRPCVAICDIGEIKRVIQNFIDNALKFTESGGRITVSLEQIDGQSVIKVTDTGKGINEEDQAKLFQRFWQATSGGRYYASTGLGLYLCRKIIELHGGRIWCESILGKGSTFAFAIGKVNSAISQQK